jgi:hypothetical protein
MPVRAVLLLTLCAGAGLGAHHSISAAYDDSRRMTVEGVVQQFQFINPHPYLIVEVAANGNAPSPWRMELDNRNELASAGVTANTWRPGDRVVIAGSPSRTQAAALYVRSLDRPADGLRYEQVGSSPRLNSRPARD